jgi:hypothetical protein
MLLKITGIHTLLATLQLSLYPSGENQLMETGIWVASYGLVISTVYFTSRSSRRRNKPKAAHWVK